MHWPETAEGLIETQRALADDAAALVDEAWTPTDTPLVGGCYVVFARGSGAEDDAGDRGWAAAVTWRVRPGSEDDEPPVRSSDRALRGAVAAGSPRRAFDVADQAVVDGQAGGAYAPGLLALREGPLLAAAVSRLTRTPDVLLVNATGLDHPRRAGLALHLGAVLGTPTVGVTHRGLLVDPAPTPTGLRRGWSIQVCSLGLAVGAWVCTRTGARPVLAHAAWRTTVETARQVVLLASTQGARTPVPLQEARRAAREARALAEAASTRR